MSKINPSLDPKPRRRLLARVIPGAVGRKNRRDIQTLAYHIRALEDQISTALPILSRESSLRSDNQAALSSHRQEISAIPRSGSYRRPAQQQHARQERIRHRSAEMGS